VANALLGLLILQGGVAPWHVYLTGLIAATVQVFQQPARHAMVPESVDRAHLTNAVALNSIAFNMSRSLGPAAAGLVIALFGPGGSYLIQAGIYLLSTVWTVQLRLPNRAPSHGGSHGHAERTFAQSTVDGWRYILHHPTIRTGLLVSAVVSFFGFSVTALLPVFAKDVLDAGAPGVGLMLTSIGIGAVVSAFLVASIGDKLHKGLVMVTGVGVYGLAVAGFALSHWLPLTLALLVVVGVCNVSSTTLIQTVLQAESAPEMRGRVMGAYLQHHILVASGGLTAGALATAWGAQPTVFGLGTACIVAALVFILAVPHIRSIR
jgi:predicted MFS family arabinose efflux permease